MTVLFLEVAQSYLFIGGTQQVSVESFAELLSHPRKRQAVGSAQAGQDCVIVAFLFGKVLNLEIAMGLSSIWIFLILLGWT